MRTLNYYRSEKCFEQKLQRKTFKTHNAFIKKFFASTKQNVVIISMPNLLPRNIKGKHEEFPDTKQQLLKSVIMPRIRSKGNWFYTESNPKKHLY